MAEVEGCDTNTPIVKVITSNPAEDNIVFVDDKFFRACFISSLYHNRNKKVGRFLLPLIIPCYNCFMTKQHEWDEYFMSLAEAAATKSKDPSTKNGCVIVDKNKRVVSLGYNGLVQGSDESKLTMEERPMKYYFSIHSEMNALLFARQSLEGCTVYNSIATCDNCLKFCLQSGIKRFVYRELRVHSHSTDPKKSMTNIETDEAVVRLLASMPDVKTLNLSNGKTYIEDILDSYPVDSPEHQRLAKWV